MKKLYVLLLALIVTNGVFAQDCNCETSFLWMKQTFEDNDAGFAYILSKKGKEAYAMHNSAYLEKVKQITSDKECAVALGHWMRFFRQGHIGVSYKAKEIAVGTVPKKTETIAVNTPEFEKYLTAKKDPGYEGIWLSEPYKIGIKKIGGSYVGFIIETTAAHWKTGEVKAKFDENGGVYYGRDKTEVKFGKSKLKLEGKNDLELGNFSLKRIYPLLKNDPDTELDLKLLKSSRPFLERLNATTVILRVPFFEITEKKYIDSVIRVNRATILATPNLIIDLRNNPGGSDESFEEILPFLYTNPVRSVGAVFLSTKLNNQRMLDLSNNPEFDEASRKQLRKYYEKLEQSLGKFVTLSDQKVDIQTRDSVYTYPQQVGILINERNGSTTEQFLLAAKQSKKVKLFGVTTFGMLDISNVHTIPFPCGKFELFYGLSKSYRIPGMAIDDIGLQPDYYIDSTIERSGWIKFANEVLNNK
ncbi:S41 family peptidase [Chitinophaga nivalis]|uniref:S41 family peptidase n=1 Tax=Chitinophaga nivalis TaxID=2991709 RepID=A0ABT3INM3_9BACT|nr:S41 family peptidase [Chitinophaga nivalis]MCW3464776.1 S41 family peptidase [Chitinophaga nivalis]MCW3485533.1 S41 family peptidase [Chitinophaga nivalis]